MSESFALKEEGYADLQVTKPDLLQVVNPELLPAHPNALWILKNLTRPKDEQLPPTSQEQAMVFIQRVVAIHDTYQQAVSRVPARRGEQVMLFAQGASWDEVAEKTGAITSNAAKVSSYNFMNFLITHAKLSPADFFSKWQEFATTSDADIDSILPIPEVIPNKTPRPVVTPSRKKAAATERTHSRSPIKKASPGKSNEDEPDEEEHESAPATDITKLYLTDIGRVALLNAEQEVDLAKRIEAGLFAGRLIVDDEAFQSSKTVGELKQKGLNTEEIIKSLQAIETDGRLARNHLLEANLRLVVSVAKRYQGKGLGLQDLIQEGNLGLARGVEKFDYTKGYKFSTYATWWIRQAIQRAIADQARTIRIPVHMVEQINKVSRIKRDLLQDLGREPTNEEISAQSGIELEKIQEMSDFARTPVSLSQLIGEDDSSALGDFIEDVDAPVAHDVVSFGLLQDDLRRILNALSEREATVIRMRYGLEDGRPRTLDEIGVEFGLTRERIRQIEQSTLKKLQDPSRANKLRDYL